MLEIKYEPPVICAEKWYYQDQSPRFFCDGCKAITSKNSVFRGDTEELICTACGYCTERKTDNHEHFI